MRSKNHARGFTLIELMLVVAIIGAIAAIAIPNFVRYQARSRRSEAFTNLAAMANAQKAFQAERNYFHDSGVDYPDAANYGPGVHGTHKMPWDSDAKTAFGELGWAPEGQVFYSYAAYTAAGLGQGCGTCPLCFTGAAYGNVDGKGGQGLILYFHPDEVGGSVVACGEPILSQPPIVDSDGNPIYDAVVAQYNSVY